MKQIAAIGGGTGLSTLMRGLKLYNGYWNLTGIVTITDNGGSSGTIRKEMNIPPPGDVRSNIVAMAKDEDLLTQLIGYRFRNEGVFEGHSVGNIILAALTRILGSFPEAVKQLSEVLAIKGRVLPVSDQMIHLVATDEGGIQYFGEEEIAHTQSRIAHLTTDQLMVAIPEVIDCLRSADGILFGPGSLFTSIIPNLLAKGVAEAIQGNRSAIKIYISNIMTQPRETVGFSLFDHYSQICKYLGQKVDLVIGNAQAIPSEILNRYGKESAQPVLNDGAVLDTEVILGQLVKLVEDPRDGLLKVRHDETELARLIFEVFDKDNNR